MNTTLNHFEGIWTALATPFSKGGEIDWHSFSKLLNRQVSAQVTGLVVCGTTGESPALSIQEKLALIKKSKSLASSKIKIMAGTGGNNTDQTIELSRLAVEAGADSLLIVTPPYNKPNYAGLVEHFRAISASVSVPICLYHVPGRTSQLLTPSQISSLCQEASLSLVKEASGDMNLFAQGVLKTPAPFLSGDDPTFLPSLAVGGKGSISVISNIFPKAFAKIFHEFEQGHIAEARRYQQLLTPLMTLLSCETNPVPLKAALAALNLCENKVRLPLAPVSPENERAIAKEVNRVKTELVHMGLYDDSN